jgi:metallo-beta-lactamase family protein
MRLTSFGAAQDVTGSKHLAEIGGHKVLFDCGLFQGKRHEAAEKNRSLPFSVKDLDVVVLSHAHIDHSGALPVLAKKGYEGPIFCTPATRDLCAIMLLDAAHIQERDAKWLSKQNRSYEPPLYDEDDVRKIMRRFVSIPYDMNFEIAPGVRLTFKEAGHVLGSAMCLVEYKEMLSRKRFLFSGDIGRQRMAILHDPWVPDEADNVLMESTYGDRDHDPIEKMDHELAEVVRRTHAKGGKLIVPTFALERAQEFIYALKRLQMKNHIPDLPVFVDSPLTVNITEVFRLHADAFDDEIREVMERSGDPFELKRITYIRNVEASKALNDLEEPAIILSAAGMCEHGRILHHLRNNCADEKNTILIIGFQAKHTLGRRIVERQPEIKIFGIKHPLLADVKVLNGLSAHAGRSDLLEFGERFKDCADKVMLVHGEDKALNALKSGLEERGCENVSIQKEGEEVDL